MNVEPSRAGVLWKCTEISNGISFEITQHNNYHGDMPFIAVSIVKCGWTESCHTEGQFLLCLCVCVGGLHPKTQFILCGKSQLESCKTYGCSAL